MFSKPLLNFFVREEEDENIVVQPKKETTNIISPDDYFAKPDCLDALKGIELRQILKHYKSTMNFKSGRVYTSAEFHFLKERFKVLYDFALVGGKPKILERLRHLFQQHRSAILIQKRLRGYLGRMSIALRGPALRNRALCVNQADGCTLEPVADIPTRNFFSYKDKDGFVYGFELDSIIQMITSASMRCTNPFNRARMDAAMPQIKKLVRLTCMAQQLSYPYFAVLGKPIYVHERHTTRPPTASSGIEQTHLPSEYNVESMIHRMRDLRTRSFADRTAALFMEIDQLGHYTQATWFTALEGHSMTRYLRYLQDFWMYRAHLSPEIKLRICPLWDPFIALLRGSVNIYDLSLEHVRTICLGVMEDMIYTGVDAESRMLGSFQVLTCLTLVSMQARQSMMYLYESVSY